MKRAILFLLPLAVVAAAHNPAAACTGFAIYGERPIYGMNFDYDTGVDVSLRLDTSGGARVFHLAFKGAGPWVPTVGMNEHGLFVSMQELHPQVAGEPSPGPDEQYPWQVYQLALTRFASAENVRRHLESTRLVHYPPVSLHLLVADPDGHAFVAEPGSDANVITPIEDEFIVMTNFANGDFADGSPDDVFGVGADRYRTAHRHLEAHTGVFDVEQAFALLQATAWHATRCSLVFDPTEREVYAAFEGDYDKIVLVSIDDRTIETFAGYHSPARWRLDSRGILPSALENPRRGLFWRFLRMLGVG